MKQLQKLKPRSEENMQSNLVSAPLQLYLVKCFYLCVCVCSASEHAPIHTALYCPKYLNLRKAVEISGYLIRHSLFPCSNNGLYVYHRYLKI